MQNPIFRTLKPAFAWYAVIAAALTAVVVWPNPTDHHLIAVLPIYAACMWLTFIFFGARRNRVQRYETWLIGVTGAIVMYVGSYVVLYYISKL